MSLKSPALAGRLFTPSPTWEFYWEFYWEFLGIQILIWSWAIIFIPIFSEKVSNMAKHFIHLIEIKAKINNYVATPVILNKY